MSSLIQIDNDKEEDNVIAASLEVNQIQNVSVSEPSHTLPRPTLVPMQVQWALKPLQCLAIFNWA